MRYLTIILLSCLISACHHHEHEGHSHNDDRHNHEGASAHAEDELAAIVHTIWTDEVEFFVEFNPLIIGSESSFAAHFTTLKDHQPVSSGNLSVSLVITSEAGESLISAVPSELASPGVFTPVITPQEAGVFNLQFEMQANELAELIVIPNVQVFASEDEALEANEPEEEGSNTIAFLKEQAWKIDFMTQPAVEQEIYDVVYSSGVWKTAPGATKSIVAPVSGVVEFKSSKLTDGGAVTKGQHLMSVSSDQLTTNNIGVNVEQSKSVYEQAESEFQRKKELYESRIIPRSEFEAVESRYLIAKSDYESLMRGYASGSKVIRAPFSGYLKSVDIHNGDFVEEGTKLISITTDKSKILESHVSPAYAVSEEDILNIWYQPRPGAWSSLNEAGGSLLSVSEQVSADHPMAAVFAQVNEEVKMPAGGFSEVQIALGNASPGIVIPETALLEDYGNFSVIVQLSGEHFERRPVRIGRHNGDMVEITSGLEVGEWVVSDGAYQVKMASMSGELPAHGHEH